MGRGQQTPRPPRGHYVPPANRSPFPLQLPPRRVRLPNPINDSLLNPIRRRQEVVDAAVEGFEMFVNGIQRLQERRQTLNVLDQIRLMSSQDNAWFRRQVARQARDLRAAVHRVELSDPNHYGMEWAMARIELVRFLRANQFYLERVVQQVSQQSLGMRSNSHGSQETSAYSPESIANAVGAVIVSTDYFSRASGGRSLSPRFEASSAVAVDQDQARKEYEVRQRNRIISPIKLPDFGFLEFHELELVVKALMECGSYNLNDPNQP